MTCPTCAAAIAGRNRAYADYDRAVAASDEILADLIKTRAAHASERESRLRAERERDEAREALTKLHAYADSADELCTTRAEMLLVAQKRIEGLEAALQKTCAALMLGVSELKRREEAKTQNTTEASDYAVATALMNAARDAPAALSSPAVTTGGLGKEGM